MSRDASAARPLFIATVIFALAAPFSAGQTPDPDKTYGWRGNWTGLFPEADPPLHWARIAKGVVAGMTCQAARPAESAPQSGQPVRDGLVRDWLVLGPFPVADSVKDFAKEQIPGERELKPAEGDKVGALTWKRFQLVKKPDYDRWGTTELDWIDLAETVGFEPNRVAYAHSYLYCQRPGKVTMVVDHGHGLAVWVNGQPVYAHPQQQMGLGSYVGISRQKKDLVLDRSPKFDVPLKQGWNGLLVKVTTANQEGWRSLKFAPRLVDAQPVYEENNILWATELPERTNAVPVVVGDRVFTVAEPDELLCLDKASGKILWRRLNGYYDALAEADRAANPVYRQQIAPLAEKLAHATDYEQALVIRRKMAELLLAADPAKYRVKWDGHLAAHFGIVGFSTTPASDGRRVYVFFGHGVVACYDLEGNRRWIRRLESREIAYSCSPALVGGKLLVLFDGLHALDAATGATLWSQPGVRSIASLIPARIRGTEVVSTREGKVFRAADGKLLWANPHIHSGDTGWGPPVILGDVMYLHWLGIGELIVADFSEVQGDAWKPKVRVVGVGADHRRPNGEWLDRWTAGSPLIHEAIGYGIDQYGVFYALDLKTDKPLYRRDCGFDELHHYNAIGVAASATLGGKYIYVLDNQGTCVVLEPGRQFKQVAVNRIETILPRDWPIPPQEILSNAAPAFDGKRIYLRGEKYLYCVGER